MDVDVTRLSSMLDDAVLDLQNATQGAPLCKVSVTGITGQTVKYFEGRWSALREVQRGSEPYETLDRWQQEYRMHEDRGSGEAWLHYSAGGVDALTELLQ